MDRPAISIMERGSTTGRNMIIFWNRPAGLTVCICQTNPEMSWRAGDYPPKTCGWSTASSETEISGSRLSWYGMKTAAESAASATGPIRS